MCVWFNTKHNFLEKFAFYIFEEMRISLKGAQSSILEKAPCTFESICWTHRAITKLPFHTIPHSSHLSALFSTPSITNFQIQTQKKIYNKFPNQVRKKKKKSEYSKIFQMEKCMGVTDEVLKEKGERKKKKSGRRRALERSGVDRKSVV